MKTNYIFGILALLFCAIVLALALPNFNQPVAFAQSADAASALQQVTPTPLIEESEIGSTDGILLMGVVIVLIVTLPLLFRKKAG